MAETNRVTRRHRRRAPSAVGQKKLERDAIVVSVLLGASLLTSVLAIGAVQPRWTMLVCTLSLAAGTVAHVRSSATKLPRSVPAAVCLGLATYSFLQALPLPLWLVHYLSPVAADIWGRALLPLGEPAPRWVSVSLDPGASMLEALKWASYAAAFSSAAWLARRHGARHAIAAFCGLTLLVAIITLAHALIGAERYFGIYEPRFSAARFGLAPLLNPNNLAGYLNLGVFCGIGLLVSPRPPIPRWVIALGILPVLGVSLLSASRGGLAALIVGAFVMCAVLHIGSLRRHSHPAFRRVSIFIPLTVLAGGVLLAGLGATRQTWNELVNTSSEKVRLVVWTKPMLGDFAWMGTGRGAFESVFPAYRGQSGRHVSYQYVENFVAQWVVEWGVVIAAVAIALLAWSLRPSRLRVQSEPLAAATWIGVLTLLLHNLLDLALEVPAVVLAVAAILGTLGGAAQRRGLPTAADGGNAAPNGVPRRVSLGRTTVLGGCAGLALLVGLFLTRAAANVDTDRRALQAGLRTLRADAQSYSELRSKVREAILRHPADPFPALIGALMARTRAGEDPLPWINRALERDPENGRTHLVLANVLKTRKAHAQALLALRMAAERELALGARVAELLLEWRVDPDHWMRAVPSGMGGAVVLSELAQRLPPQHVKRKELVSAAVERDPNSASARNARVLYLLTELSNGESVMCRGAERDRCVSTALVDADHIAMREPRSPRGIELRARVLDAADRTREAEALLSENCGRFVNASECWKRRAEYVARLNDPARLREAIDSYVASSCATAERCSSAALWAGYHLQRNGQAAMAVNYFARAAHENPSPDTWLALASAAQQVGQRERARAALARAGRAPRLAPADLPAIADEIADGDLPPREIRKGVQRR